MTYSAKPERFWACVDASGPCWLWTGSVDHKGYGRNRGTRAHRVAWELLVGPIPKGLTLDHLCRVRNCVNPDHLEVVTNRENIMRSPITLARIAAETTHCPQGHPYDAENTKVIPSRPNARYCRMCHRENARRYRANKQIGGDHAEGHLRGLRQDV